MKSPVTSSVLAALWLPAVVALGGGPSSAAAPDEAPPIRFAPSDWPWWRGPNRDNIASANQDPPLRWSPTENVVWKSPVPGRGHASPTLWGDRLLLPTADKQEISVLCIDRQTGRKLWQTAIHRGGLMRMNPKNSHASATAACDGQLVFQPAIARGALWLTALDFEGKIAFQTRLGDFVTLHGFAASPVVWKSLVIVAADQLKGSFLAAVHRRTGQVVWRTDRDSYKLGTYASPVFGRVAGRDQLLIQGPYEIYSYDPASGKGLWHCKGPDESASSTVTFDDQCVYAAAGYPRRNLLCVRADGAGDVTATHIVWSRKDNAAYVPSLLLADGLLYMVEDAGKVTCFEARTGRVVWEGKLPGAFSSSPVLAGGRIYVANEAGVTYVLKPGRTFELLAQNDLADGAFATPVVSGGRIYLRTFHWLYCLGAESP